MVKTNNVWKVLFIGIFLLNVFIIAFPLNTEYLEASDHFLASWLRNLGFEPQQPDYYQHVPLLTSGAPFSIPSNQSYSKLNNLKLSEYFVPGWADTRWQYRKNITIDSTKVNSDLINFPLLIELYDSDLQQDAQASGNDILFTDITGSILDHEIELYERVYNSTHAKLVTWVKVPIISDLEDTVISMYFGNPSATNQEDPEGIWEDYIGIWHLNELENSTRYDSTSNNLDGTPGDYDNDEAVTGFIDGADDFDGINDHIIITDPGSGSIIDFNTADTVTLSAWIRPDSFPEFWNTILTKGSTPSAFANYGLQVFESGGTGVLDFFYRDALDTEWHEYQTSTQIISTGNWYHVFFSYTFGLGTSAKFFVNGSLVSGEWTSGDGNADPLISNAELWFGADDNAPYGSPNELFDGMIDEIRILGIARSADWINAEYLNQHDPDNFYNIALKENYGIYEWNINSFRFRKNITIDPTKVFQDIKNFPLLIDLYDSDLHDREKVQPDGDDILFTTNEDWIWSPELMNNGGFETNDFTGWTLREGNWELGITPPMGDKTPQSGSYCAYLGYESSSTDFIQQDVDISSYSTYVDNGKAVVNASGWMIAAEDGYDYSRIRIQYLNAAKGLLSTALDTGLQMPSIWTKYGVYLNSVPVNTRYIRVWAQCIEEPYDAGSIDTFSVKIATYQKQETEIKLDHEIELFDQTGNGTHAHLVAWVRVPFLSNTLDTSIIMYYGNHAIPSQENPEGVWTSQYLTVHHMEESPTSTLYDSTKNNKDLTTRGSMTVGDLVDGQLGKGIDFDNINDAAYSSTTLSFNQFTFSAWIYPDTMEDWDCILNLGNLDSNDFEWIGLNYGVFTIDTEFISTPIGSALPSDDWYYLVISYDGSTLRGYIDSSLEDTYSRNLGSINERFSIGAFAGDSSYSFFYDFFDGIIDEVRIINSPRSAGWISTEYENQLNPNTFYSISEEEINDNWWVDSSFTSRKDLVIDHNKVAGEIIDFPLLVKISDTSFKSGKVQNDGSDILFVDGNGTKLPHEIELFSQNNTHGDLVAWVKVPVLKNNEDTIISIYYGNSQLSDQENPTQVWDTDYRAVWHLNDDPTGLVYDSTKNGFDGSSGGGMTTTNLVSSKIDKGIVFDGINDYVAFSDPLNTQTMTISSWVNLEEASSNWITIALRADSSVTWFDWQFYARASDAELANEAVFRTAYPDTSEVGSNSVLSTNNWYYMVVQHNGTHNLFYINGNLSEIDQEPDTVTDSDRDIWIGGNEVWGEWLQGLLDEIRFSNVARSADWILTEYNNQEDPQGFYSIGPELNLAASINIEESITAGVENVNQIIVSGVSGVPHHLYLLVVSTKEYSGTTSVSGLGLAWVELEDQPSGRSATGVSVWYAIGTTTINSGDVTVTVSSVVKSLAVQLHRFSGVDINDPIGVTESANTNGENGAGSGGVDDSYPILDIITTAKNSTVFGAVGRRHYVFASPGIGYTTLVENQVGSSGDIAGISTEYKTVNELGTVIVNAILTSDCDWALAAIEINPLIIDIHPPTVKSFGIEQTGNGIGKFWAKIDDISEVKSAEIKINNSIYSMSNNGTHWIYQLVVSYNDFYEYEICNTTDNWGNRLEYPSNKKSIIIDYDIVTPTVEQWEYYNTIGPYGTFKANVSDSWGTIDTVIINVTEAGGAPRNDLWAIMRLTASGYMNDTLIMPSGTIKYVIRVNDTAGNSFTSSEHQGLVSTANQPPSVENVTLSRSAGSVLLPIYSNNILYLDYDYTDPESDPDQSEIRWYKNGIYQPTYDDQKQIPASALVKEDEWNVTINPYDGQDFGDLVASLLVEIQNTPPSATSVVVLPGSPVTTSTLSVSYSYSDYDGDSQNTANREIRWYKEGVLQSALNDLLSVASGFTSKGEEWYYEIRVHDGTNYSSWVTSTSVTIVNSVPAVTAVQVLPSTPVTGDILTANYTFTDADGDGESGSLIRWYKNGVLQKTLNDSLAVDLSLTLKGESWYFTVQPGDGTTYGTLKQAPTIVIGNTAPTAASLQIIPGTPNTGDILNADYTFIDADNDAESGTLIIWYKDGILQGSLNGSDDVIPSYTSKGEEWHFKVRPSDGIDSGSWYSCPVNVTIINTEPSINNLALNPSFADTTDDLLITYDYSDADSDPESAVEVLWYMNGSLQGQFNDSTILQAGNTTKGQIWHVKARVFDGTAYSSWVSISQNITIINSPPIVSDVRLNGFNGPTQISDTDDLVASYIYFDPDNDLQINASREIIWYKKNQSDSSFVLQGHLNNSLLIGSGNTSVGDTWYFKIRVYDGSDYSSLMNSPSVSIGVPPNTPPEAKFLNITPANPVTSDSLTLNYTFVDSDNDNESDSMYYWYRNGVLMSEYNGLKTLPAFATTKGEIWHVKVRPRDGIDFGPLASVLINVTIGNTAPEANTLQINPSTPKTANDLSVSYNFVDIDGDIEAGSDIIWFVNGILQPLLNGSSVVTASNTIKGQEWHVKLRPKDGTTFGTWISCPVNITIGNSAPSVTMLTIIPINPKTSENLNASYIFSDPDAIVGDEEINSLIRWFKNGEEQLGYENQTIIPYSATKKGENWWFEVTPFDGMNYGSNKVSPLITIKNTAPTANNLEFTPSVPLTDLDLSVSYLYTDIDNDIESGTSILWFKNGILQPTFNGMDTVDGTVLLKGDRWNVSIQVSDGSEYSPWLNGSIIIANTPPMIITDSAEIVNPISGLTTTSSLIAIWNSYDADGDPILDYKITWENRTSGSGSFSEQSLLENLTEVPALYTSKNQDWRFKIQVFDGAAWSVTSVSFLVTIQNSEPVISNIILSGGQTTTNSISVSYDFYDADGDPDQSEILWGIFHITPPFIFIPGTQTLLSSEFVAGDLIWVEITPDDNDASTGQGDTVDTSKMSGVGKQIQVGDTAPQINTTLGLPTILADHPDGSTLYTAGYSLYVNYSSLVYDIDSKEDCPSVFKINFDNNENIIHSSVSFVIGTQYRWYKFNSETGRFELQPSLTGQIVASQYLHRDEQWMVSVCPRDNYGYLGNWVNSTPIVIGNSYPQVTRFQWSTAYPTTSDDLSFSFDYDDNDGDLMIISQTLIIWYKNGLMISGVVNQTILVSTNFVKGDNITVVFRPYDGIDWALSNYTSPPVIIVNSPPIASNITLTPLSPSTLDPLVLTWTFTDADNDSENADYRIEWRRSGVLIPEFENMTTIPFINTSKGETWQAQIWVFDGTDYSYVGYTSNDGNVIVIQNTPMEIINLQFVGINTQTTANETLQIEWDVSDVDNDGQVDYEISWFCDEGNGSFIHKTEFDVHLVSVPSISLLKGQSWYCIIKVYDGTEWSSNMTSSIISIMNAAPEVSNLVFVFNPLASQVEPDIRTYEFYVQDEDINISFNYYDIDNDVSQIKIEWFKMVNGSILEITSFENASFIPTEALIPGEYWFCQITPYDGFTTGNPINSSIIPIYSRPVCYSYDITPETQSEGIYQIAVSVTDILFEVTEVQVKTIFYDNSSKTWPASKSQGNNWTLEFILEDLSYLDTNMTIEIKCITSVADFEIYAVYFLEMLLEDKAPPRVDDAYFEFNDEKNPTNLTFEAYVQEFGLGVTLVELFYYFRSVNESEGNGAAIAQVQPNRVTMNFKTYDTTTNCYIYETTVNFVHNNMNIEIIYWISTTDNANNTDDFAFDIRDYPQRIKEQRFIYSAPGLPEWVLLVAGMVVVLIFVGAVVYVKFIRKPELVGLDKELVLSKVSEISEAEVQEVLDEHTIGIVISFFDQRHGPIPIVIIPELLKDNFNKLVELSDRSFSGTGFSDNFDTEIPSSYDFVLDQGVRSSILSFGFALNRPAARGGQENITLNILIHQDLFPLIQSFQKPIQAITHEIHMIMNEESTEKDIIRQRVVQLRRYVSSIVLSYVKIYGTTDLIEEE